MNYCCCYYYCLCKTQYSYSGGLSQWQLSTLSHHAIEPGFKRLQTFGHSSKQLSLPTTICSLGSETLFSVVMICPLALQ